MHGAYNPYDERNPYAWIMFVHVYGRSFKVVFMLIFSTIYTYKLLCKS